MTTSVNILTVPLEGLRRWIGPVLEKELRTLSRRKRLYWLRALYPLLLGLMAAVTWFGAGLRGQNASFDVARLAEISRTVVSSAAWLQFIVCQIMAVVLLSHAMNDEIRRRTLAALMTTPIRSFQIVLGKLLGHLLPIWIVLALSFPLLAIIRVWGGVPWDYVASSLSVTLCATFCWAAVSLLLALWIERPHRVMSLLLSVMIIGYFLGGLFMQLGWISVKIVQLINPFVVLMSLNMEFSQAGVAANVEWQEHCLLMLGMAAVFLLASVLCLRSRALAKPGKQTEQHGRLTTLLRRLFYGDRGRNLKTMRSVSGAPLLWKELGNTPGTYLKRQIPWIVILSGILLGTLVPPLLFSFPARRPGFALYTLGASAVGLLVRLRTATMAAMCVAQEKESRSWTVLLCTPLPDVWILRHKALAVILKNAAGWISLLMGSMAMLIFLILSDQPGLSGGNMMEYAIGSFIGTVTSLYLVTAAGMYFSVRVRTGVMAVMATLGFLIVYYVVLRFLVIILIAGLITPNRASGLMSMYTVASLLLSVTLGAIMFKLAGKGLRKYIF